MIINPRITQITRIIINHEDHEDHEEKKKDFLKKEKKAEVGIVECCLQLL